MSRLVSSICALGLAACASTEPRSAGPWTELPTGWSRLEPPPFVRARAVSVWTGSELVYWGGDTDFHASHPTDGAAYDPATATWRRLPRGPLSGRSRAAAVWTGNEVLIWDGWPDLPPGDGAAFDPATRTWRMLAASPLSARIPVVAVWTGREMIVWGDASRSSTARDGAAYDPETDRWRKLPPSPLVLNQASVIWTGAEMVVFGSLLDGHNHSSTAYAQGIAYDPERNAWRVIAPSRLSPQASTIAWTGKEILAWDYLLQAGLYDPVRDTWARPPGLPLSAGECYPKSAQAAGALVAWYCGREGRCSTPKRALGRRSADRRS